MHGHRSSFVAAGSMFGSIERGCQSCFWSNEEGKCCFPLSSPFAPESSVLQDSFGRPVPRQPGHSPTSRVNLLWFFLTGSFPAFGFPSRCPYTPSAATVITPVRSLIRSSRNMRTDGVHHRESTGKGLVVSVLKVAGVTGAS